MLKSYTVYLFVEEKFLVEIEYFVLTRFYEGEKIYN